MGSEIERDFESSNLKKKLYILVLENNLIGLRELGQRLGPIQRGIFRKRYGNLLGLLEAKIQVPAVTALAQHSNEMLHFSRLPTGANIRRVRADP